MKRWILCAVAASLPMMAQADPAGECSDGSSQVQIGNCVSKIEKLADQSMIAIYDFALRAAKELDELTERPVSVPALKASQEAWENFRDQHCEFVGTTFGGGSGTGIAVSSCRIELTRAREVELRNYTR